MSKMNISKFGLVLFIIMTLLQATALILEKKGMSQVGAIGDFGGIFSWQTIFKVISNPYVMIGLVLLVISSVLWLVVLSNTDISYIYPLGAVIYIVITVLAYFILSEPITWTKVMGSCVIVGGCVLINWR